MGGVIREAANYRHSGKADFVILKHVGVAHDLQRMTFRSGGFDMCLEVEAVAGFFIRCHVNISKFDK